MIGSNYQSLLYIFCGMLDKSKVIGLSTLVDDQAKQVFLSYGFHVEYLNPNSFVRDIQRLNVDVVYVNTTCFTSDRQSMSERIREELVSLENDMIFSVVCEELGLFGGICLILLFGMMIWRFVIIALHSPDMFGFLLVAGVTAHIAIQVILNIAVVTNMIPNTGITLPFISYGGTSVMFLLAEMGIVLNVSSIGMIENAYGL